MSTISHHMDHLTTYLDLLEESNPLLSKLPRKLNHEGDAAYHDFAEKLTASIDLICKHDPDARRHCIQSYLQLSLEYLVLQKELEETGRYRYQTFEEAYTHVYNNSEVMGEYYLEGLLLSQIWWPNHYKIYRFFCDYYLPELPDKGIACEIGPGHGLFTSTFLKTKTQWSLQAYDVSRSSIDFTKKFINLDYPAGHQRLDLILKAPSEQPELGDSLYDTIICGEVLEHLEDPLSFVKALAAHAKPGAPIYLTAAIYAANLDHIYLFHDVAEVKALIQEAGLNITRDCILNVDPNHGPDDRDVPINYALVATR